MSRLSDATWLENHRDHRVREYNFTVWQSIGIDQVLKSWLNLCRVKCLTLLQACGPHPFPAPCELCRGNRRHCCQQLDRMADQRSAAVRNINKDVVLQWQTLLIARWGGELARQGVDVWRELNLSATHKTAAQNLAPAVASRALLNLQGWLGQLGPQHCSELSHAVVHSARVFDTLTRAANRDVALPSKTDLCVVRPESVQREVKNKIN